MKYSLLFQTDLMVLTSRVTEDLGDYALFHTPTNPTFFGGNGIALGAPMTKASLPVWEANFERRFPHAKHRFFEWASPAPLSAQTQADFEAAGYDCTTCAAMTTPSPELDQRLNAYLSVEPVRSDPGWAEVLEFWLDCYPQHGFAFHARRAADFRTRVGTGDWWVARAQSGQVVGSMGLYFGEGLGRFQNVDTHRRFRRQGVCRTLMHGVLSHAVAHHEFEALVIAVDEGSFTQRLYASFGFQTQHFQISLMKTP